MNVVGRKGENWADVNVFLAPQDERDFTQGEFASAWREEVGEVPGLESLYFEWEEGPGSGAGLTVQLSHPDREQLEAAAESLASQLATVQGVTDIKDGLPAGKGQIDVWLVPMRVAATPTTEPAPARPPARTSVNHCAERSSTPRGRARGASSAPPLRASSCRAIARPPSSCSRVPARSP
jgi:hypothetical protein